MITPQAFANNEPVAAERENVTYARSGDLRKGGGLMASTWKSATRIRSVAYACVWQAGALLRFYLKCV